MTLKRVILDTSGIPQKTSGYATAEKLKSSKTNPIDSGTAKIITSGLRACPQNFKRLFKALQLGNKMFLKFVKKLLKKPGNIILSTN